MSNYCKHIEKVFAPTIERKGEDPKLLWLGRYNDGLDPGGKVKRAAKFIDSKITEKQREEEFNRYLINKWYDHY